MWSRTELLGWCVIAGAWIECVCVWGYRGASRGFTQDEGCEKTTPTQIIRWQSLEIEGYCEAKMIVFCLFLFGLWLLVFIFRPIYTSYNWLCQLNKGSLYQAWRKQPQWFGVCHLFPWKTEKIVAMKTEIKVDKDSFFKWSCSSWRWSDKGWWLMYMQVTQENIQYWPKYYANDMISHFWSQVQNQTRKPNLA